MANEMGCYQHIETVHIIEMHSYNCYGCKHSEEDRVRWRRSEMRNKYKLRNKTITKNIISMDHNHPAKGDDKRENIWTEWTKQSKKCWQNEIWQV